MKVCFTCALLYFGVSVDIFNVFFHPTLSLFIYLIFSCFYASFILFQGFPGIAGERGADGPPGSVVGFVVIMLLCSA